MGGTIELGSSLPTITRKVRIEGSMRPTQCETEYFGVPGPCTGIDGPVGGTAFRVSAPGVQLIGFAISNAKTAAEAVGGPGLWLWNDWIGLKLDGSAGPVETGALIDQNSNGANFGGYGSLPRDIFARVTGVALDIDGADAVTVRGNGFGVMPDGATPAPNGTNIRIGDAASGENRTARANWIGDRLEDESLPSPICDGFCNVIAAAKNAGIDLGGNGTTEEPATGSTRIFGNYIGLDAFGRPLANETAGVLVGGAISTTIGGPVPGDRNVIDGGTHGILAGPNGGQLTVEGNLIGLNPAGTATLEPPTQAGIAITGGSDVDVFGNRLSLLTGRAIETAAYESLIERNVIGEGVTGARLPGGTEGIGLPRTCLWCAVVRDNSILDATKYGVRVEGSHAELYGNRIEGSGEAGIDIEPQGKFESITLAIVGGDTAAEENTISANSGPAIRMVEKYIFSTVYDEVLRNHGSANAGPFIALVNGANGGIKPPTFAGSSESGASGRADPGAVVRVFRKADSSAGEIESFLAEAVTNESGTWSVTYPGPIPAGTMIAASQTSDEFGSSEYAFATTTTPPPPAAGGGGNGLPEAGIHVNQAPPPARVLSHPDTFIVKRPARNSASRTARFVFRTDQSQARFRCKFDDRLIVSCRSPQSYRGLKFGKHVFKVWAVDPDGGEDASPVSWTFSVQRGPAPARSPQ
ncbi:MAG TPA: right-handed parallel beta-helix repeat-containing protein [Solirubrobacterales bacterium]|nr:right-handed parallel beta-helix repeat-containing protein [Solirubrobacterales bacterium]